MHCTPAYVKKNNCSAGPQFSYSDCCMHVSHKNENYQKKQQQEKKHFVTVTLFPPQILVEQPFFQKKKKKWFVLQIPRKSLLPAYSFSLSSVFPDHLFYSIEQLLKKKHSRNNFYQGCINFGELTFWIFLLTGFFKC